MHAKQVRALRLAVEALEHVRQERFSAGHYAYLHGIRADVIHDPEVEGEMFSFAWNDYAKAEEYDQAVQQLEDLIEILSEIDAHANTLS